MMKKSAYVNKSEGNNALLTETVFKVILPNENCLWKESIGVQFPDGGYAGFRRGVKYSERPIYDSFLGGSFIVGVCNVTPTFGCFAEGNTFLYGKVVNSYRHFVACAIVTVPGTAGSSYDIDRNVDDVKEILIDVKRKKQQR